MHQQEEKGDQITDITWVTHYVLPQSQSLAARTHHQYWDLLCPLGCWRTVRKMEWHYEVQCAGEVMGQGLLLWVLRRCSRRTGKKWTTDSSFLAHLRSSMHLRAVAAVDGPGSTCQEELQNPKLVLPELCHFASKIIKFSCPPGKTSSICMINTIHR